MNQKLDVARVFERIFEIYRDQFTLLIPAALAVFVPVAVLSGLIYAGGVTLLGALLVAAIATIATYWFQGMVVEAARDILDGRRDHNVGSLVRSTAPVVGPLVLAAILAGIAVGIGLLLLIVPGLFLLTIWAVLAPVIVIERRSAIEAFGRSRELVRGHGWQVFSVIAVLFVIQLVVGWVIQAVADSVSDTFTGYAVADLLLRMLIAPLTALAAAVLYFELKSLRGEPVLAVGPGGQVEPAAAPGTPPAPRRRRPHSRRPRRPRRRAPNGSTQGSMPASAHSRVSSYSGYGRVNRHSSSAWGGAGGFGEEALCDSPADFVLLRDALFARGADALGVERGVGRLGVVPSVEPGPQALARDLGVELQPPSGLPLDAERLDAGRGTSELHGAGRQRRDVVVPLEQLNRRCERPDHRVGRPSVGDLDLVPPDLGLGRAVRGGARRLCEELAPEAHTEDRLTPRERIADELLLWAQPSVLVLLIQVHRAPEDEQGVGHGRRGRGAGHPGRKVAEHARAGV